MPKTTGHTLVRGGAMLKPSLLKSLKECAGPCTVEIPFLVCPWKSGSCRDHPLGAHLFNSLHLHSGEGLHLVALAFLTNYPVHALGMELNFRVKGTIHTLGKRLRLCFGLRLVE